MGPFSLNTQANGAAAAAAAPLNAAGNARPVTTAAPAPIARAELVECGKRTIHASAAQESGKSEQGLGSKRVKRDNGSATTLSAAQVVMRASSSSNKKSYLDLPNNFFGAVCDYLAPKYYPQTSSPTTAAQTNSKYNTELDFDNAVNGAWSEFLYVKPPEKKPEVVEIRSSDESDSEEESEPVTVKTINYALVKAWIYDSAHDLDALATTCKGLRTRLMPLQLPEWNRHKWNVVFRCTDSEAVTKGLPDISFKIFQEAIRKFDYRFVLDFLHTQTVHPHYVRDRCIFQGVKRLHQSAAEPIPPALTTALMVKTTDKIRQVKLDKLRTLLYSYGCSDKYLGYFTFIWTDLVNTNHREAFRWLIRQVVPTLQKVNAELAHHEASLKSAPTVTPVPSPAFTAARTQLVAKRQETVDVLNQLYLVIDEALVLPKTVYINTFRMLTHPDVLNYSGYPKPLHALLTCLLRITRDEQTPAFLALVKERILVLAEYKAFYKYQEGTFMSFDRLASYLKSHYDEAFIKDLVAAVKVITARVNPAV